MFHSDVSIGHFQKLFCRLYCYDNVIMDYDSITAIDPSPYYFFDLKLNSNISLKLLKNVFNYMY